MSVYSIIPPAAAAAARQYSSKEMDCATDVGSHLFTILLITVAQLRLCDDCIRLCPELKRKKDKSFSLSHNKIDERHFVTDMSTGFFFFFLF